MELEKMIDEFMENLEDESRKKIKKEKKALVMLTDPEDRLSMIGSISIEQGKLIGIQFSRNAVSMAINMHQLSLLNQKQDGSN